MCNQISIYDSPAIDRLRAELKFDPRRLRALRTAFFKKSRGVDEALGELPAEVRTEFARRVEFHPLTLTEGLDSQLDGATKLEFNKSGVSWRLDCPVLKARENEHTNDLSDQDQTSR